ncbi:TPA: hypothetical protein JTH48_002732 [Escherichia coli]|uniref:Prophage protein n=1 Tax=Salmonella enterica subsp. enterica serovar Typhi str. CT18 TaxID=220341 RepID=A0A716SXF9_SALTI|nr:hypothetical protein [Escherichia coli]HAD5564194.1 hypothetical protein [Salmonella enterica subsp. enterica serovar Typhi str. CT18]HEC6767233.1 hypothetical protein [Salmonella enterica subsp. enterica serovar Virchow]EFD0435161.1 hypothetical protein [Escherichia coli]EFF2350524.1 hypothetical protein [Escherichia coli]EFH3063592.1 hypothetical protein [Escherichia coli]
MTTITKERLQWLANISGRDDIDDIDGGEIRELALIALASLEAVPDGLVKAVRFYEQVKHENPPVETGAWKDAVDWVLKEASLAVNTGIKGENDAGIKD